MDDRDRVYRLATSRVFPSLPQRPEKLRLVEVSLMSALPLNTNDGKVLLSLIDDSFIGYMPVFLKAYLKFWGLSAVS